MLRARVMALVSLVGAIVFVATIVACSTGHIGEAESGNANAVAPEIVTPGPDAGTGPAVDPSIPTFAADVEPIVQEKCQNCHRDGGIAPFALISYEDVKGHGYEAQRKVTAREMPPWGAFDQKDCELSHGLKDDLRLSDAQISTISRWVDGGMPLGDESKRPPPRKSFPATRIEGATPYKIAKPYKVQPGADEIRCFPIDPGITEDTWVTATNVVPDEPRVVHHVIVYLDVNKKAPAKAGEDGSYKCFGGPNLGEGGGGATLLLAWAPGVPPTGLGQSESAIKIPKNSGLVMQVHYHPTKETLTDQSSFELLKLPPGETPKYVAQVMLAGNARDAAGSNTGGVVKLLEGPSDPPEGPAFLIPSNAEAHTEEMSITAPSVPITLRLALAGAHMHWAGTNMTLTIDRGAPPEGQPKKECLVSTPKYDFNWQRGYAYDEPYDKLPTINGGDKLHLKCTYNNSPKNKNVAKAMDEERVAEPFDLKLGETTHDEMCLSALVILRDFIPLYD